MIQVLHVLVACATIIMAKTPSNAAGPQPATPNAGEASVMAKMPPNAAGPQPATPDAGEASQKAAASDRPYVSIITNVNVNVTVSKSVKVDVSTGVNVLSSGQTAAAERNVIPRNCLGSWLAQP